MWGVVQHYKGTKKWEDRLPNTETIFSRKKKNLVTSGWMRPTSTQEKGRNEGRGQRIGVKQALKD